MPLTIKRTCFVILTIICLVQGVSAQIIGRLTSPAGQPIPAANVLVLRTTDSSLVKAALTDDKGIYLFSRIPAGNYILRFSSVGFQSMDSTGLEISDLESSKDLGTLILKEAPKQLGEVVVRAERPLFQQQVGGTVVNVENSVLTKGSSALEVLERSPGVILDRQNNGISLNGKTGVMVMLNGKMLRMSMNEVTAMLNGMSADNIEKIELLTTPPAKYDAQGSAGLINIVTKKSRRKGTTGTVSLTGGWGWGEKATGNATLDHNTGTFDVYGSYTYMRDHSFTDWHSIGTNNQPLLGGDNTTDILSETKSRANNHNATLGFEAKVDPSWTIGANVNYSNTTVVPRTQNTASYIVHPDSLYYLNATIDGRNHWQNWIGSVYAEKKLKDGGTLAFDVDYLYYKNSNPSHAKSEYVDAHGEPAGSNDTLFSPYQQSLANTDIRVAVGKVDYNKQLSAKLKMEAGLKGTYTEDQSTSTIQSLVNGQWVSRPETSNDIRMREQVGAGYLSFTEQFDPNTSLVLGARYEYSHTRMRDPLKDEVIAERKLGAIFPNVAFSKRFGASEFIASYSKRISRPTYNDLASFVVYTSPNSVESGNPFLQPTITHNLKLGYSYKSYAFSLLFSRDLHPIAGYQLAVSPDGDLIDLRPENMVYQNNVTLQASLPFKISNWWNMTYSFAGGYRHFKEDFTEEPAEKTYYGYSANASQQFKLPKDLMLEVSGWYNGPSYVGTKKTDGFGAVNAGIKKDFPNNGGTLQFSVADIFRTVNITSRYGTLTREAFDVKSHVVFTAESGKAQIFKLTYSKSFGGGGSKNRRGSGSDDERERVRK